MGLTLADGVHQTRVKLGELIPNFWNDEDIVYDLNYAAQDMCSEAQYLEQPVQFLWPNVPGTPAGTVNPIQEAALQPWVDQVLRVSIYSGQAFELQAVDAADVQVATKVGNIPLLFYTRTGSTLLSPQGAGNNSGDFSIFPVEPQLANTPEFSTILGLWPVPSSNYDTTIWVTRFHPQMTNPLDICAVPARYSQNWIAYAVARAKEKESAIDEAAYYQGIYEKGKKDFNLYCTMHKQLKTPPSYGGTAWPSLARGSSSIIFIDQNPGALNP
jgi:hypothetical protein